MDDKFIRENRKYIPLCVLLLALLVTGYTLVYEIFYTWRQIFAGLVAVSSCSIAFGSYKFYRLLPENLHYSLQNLTKSFFIRIYLYLYGAFSFHKLLEQSKSFSELQNQILFDLLLKNEKTKYGRKFNFKKIHSREHFVREVPLTTYDDVRQHVENIAKGKKGVLTIVPPRQLVITSGTTGMSKLIPKNQNSDWHFLSGCVAPVFYCITETFPDFHSLGKQLRLSFSDKFTRSAAGLYIRDATYGMRTNNILMTTPRRACDLGSDSVDCYMHWVFALKDRGVTCIEAADMSVIYKAFSYLQKNWSKICQDIDFGGFDPDLPIATHLRKKLDTFLGPDPIRAAELRTAFYQGFDGLARRIWPNLQVITAQDGGDMAFHGRLLSQSYCRGVTMYSTHYSAAEAMIGINIWPEADTPEYLLYPRHVFYEFIPLDYCGFKDPRTVFGDQVEIGKTYEVVVTAKNGLTRYRMGDVVEVTRLYNHTPVVKFIYRYDQVLNICSELTPGQMVTDALCEMLTLWPDLPVIDYCCTNYSKGQKSNFDIVDHYILYVEVTVNQALPKSFSEEMDQSLRNTHADYNEKREKGAIKPLETRVVREGTFRELKGHRQKKVNNNANHFKVPRVLILEEDVAFIQSNVIS